ncbi:Ff.00g065200.m01.CDS01 [Fusarium sp. VM40]|nr:Ff.00g065200.m01.CDS01 [Fusarium sp. VM40]
MEPMAYTSSQTTLKGAVSLERQRYKYLVEQDTVDFIDDSYEQVRQSQARLDKMTWPDPSQWMSLLEAEQPAEPSEPHLNILIRGLLDDPEKMTLLKLQADQTTLCWDVARQASFRESRLHVWYGITSRAW